MRDDPVGTAILIGGGPNSVSACRSLSAAGVRVYALSDGYRAIRFSRYCTATLLPNGKAELEEEWLAWLRDGPREGVTLPCSDEGVEFISRHGRDLRELGYVTGGSDQFSMDMLDKQRTYELARQCEIETPKTLLDDDEARRAAFAARVGFPCAVKARSTHRARRHGLPGMQVAGSLDEVVSGIGRLGEFGLDAIITELIPGPEENLWSYYSYIDSDGRPLFEVTKRKLRLYPLQTGHECYEKLTWSEEVAEAGRRFVEGVGLSGVAHVEFKRDARDGALRLVECNPRFTASLELLKRSGVDLAVIAYRAALGLPTESPSDVRYGLHAWSPVEDVRALLAHRRLGDLTFQSWAKSLMHRQLFEVFTWSDPLPTAAATWGLAVRFARRPRLSAPPFKGR